MDYFSIQDEGRLCAEYSNWMTTELQKNALTRNQDWSESIAVGRKSFTTDIQQQLAGRAQKRSIISIAGGTVLKEPEISYSAISDGKNDVLSSGNAYFWR